MSRESEQEVDYTVTELLSGEILSPEKQEIVDKWLEKEENRKKFYRMQCLRAAIYALETGKKVNGEKKWKELAASIKPHSRWQRFLPYAALMILLIGTGLLLHTQHKKPEVYAERLAGETIVPGHKQALLTLSDGRQIILSDSLSPLKEQNGSMIRNTGSQLVYDLRDTCASLVYNTIQVPRGGEYKLTLSDGSTIWINSESEVTYPVTFGHQEREIRLKGEAFFDIQKSGERPFIVRTTQFNIRVTGTQFNIRTYPDEIASATLARGGIQVEKNNLITRLVPGQQASLINGQIEVKEVDLEEAMAWRNEVFCFRQRPLGSLLNEIARWYDLDLFYQNPEARNYHFTAWFRRSTSIHELINILEKTGNIKFELKGKTLTVRTNY